MDNYDLYYSKIKDAKPHDNLEMLSQIDMKNMFAIELGCGIGRDTVYLLKNGYSVLGIDREKTEEIIREKLTTGENGRFTFLNMSFEEIKELPLCDLVLSNLAIPFCNPKFFEKFWEIVCNSIKSNGYFLGNFFGKEDEWNGKKKLMSFFDVNEVKELFKDFEIIEINEKICDKNTVLGALKHWDIIEVFARKK